MAFHDAPTPEDVPGFVPDWPTCARCGCELLAPSRRATNGEAWCEPCADMYDTPALEEDDA